MVIQMLVFGCFILVAYKVNANLKDKDDLENVKWQPFVRFLFFASFCITLRNLVRVIEYAEGTSGYVASHDAFIYVFDALLMLGVIVGMLSYHPGRLSRSMKKKEKLGEQSLITDAEEVKPREEGDEVVD